MKTIFTLVLFFTIFISSAFGQQNRSDLQIEFDRSNDYIIQIGKSEFRSNGSSLFIENMDVGFHPISIFKQERRNRRLLYSGGINLAPNSITYSLFFRNNLTVQEVVSSAIPEVIVMNDETFKRFKSSIEKENFSSNKLEMLENQLALHFFTSEQISDLVVVLKFDSDQLELAKLAFERTADPQNYFLVVEKLKFSSSKKELNQHIQKVNQSR